MRKTMRLHVIRDEIACIRHAVTSTHEGTVRAAIERVIDEVEASWLAFGREPSVVGGSVSEGQLACAIHGIRKIAAEARGLPAPPSPTAHLEVSIEAAKALRDEVAVRRSVREELRQADLAQHRAERKAARDAMPKPVREKAATDKPAKAEPAGIIHDPRQMSLF